MLRDSTNLPFFRYFKLRTRPWAMLPQLVQVPTAEMPMSHTQRGARRRGRRGPRQPDRQPARRAGVFKVTNGEVGTRERTERISLNIPLPNMGVKSLKICGGEPVFGQPLTAVLDPVGGVTRCG